MECLYVLYDAHCGLCSWARRWLMRQPKLIDMKFIPAGSALAGRLFPGLYEPGEHPEELVVVSDQGAVYRHGSAWIMCLFALEAYRDWANRLAHPLLQPLARQAFALLSRQRSRISRWLCLASEMEIAETLSRVIAPACAPPSTTALTKPAPAEPPSAGPRSSQADHDIVFTFGEPFPRPGEPP
jgi:predicted DCC family thiol-disulfide oxidoreductase YuxK